MSDKSEKIKILLGTIDGISDELINAAVALLLNEETQPAVDEPLLCQKELCEVLKISHTTLWRLNPPHYMVGSRKRYKRSQVYEYLLKRQQQAKPATEDVA